MTPATTAPPFPTSTSRLQLSPPPLPSTCALSPGVRLAHARQPLRDTSSAAHSAFRAVGAHRFHPCKTLSLGAEMMPGVFLESRAGAPGSRPPAANGGSPPPRPRSCTSPAGHRHHAKALLPLPQAPGVDAQLPPPPFSPPSHTAQSVLDRRSLEGLIILLPLLFAFSPRSYRVSFTPHVHSPIVQWSNGPPNRGKGNGGRGGI